MFNSNLIQNSMKRLNFIVHFLSAIITITYNYVSKVTHIVILNFLSSSNPKEIQLTFFWQFYGNIFDAELIKQIGFMDQKSIGLSVFV